LSPKLWRHLLFLITGFRSIAHGCDVMIDILPEEKSPSESVFICLKKNCNTF
jgi:hypothetical protein